MINIILLWAPENHQTDGSLITSFCPIIHILSFCPHNALGCGLAGEICMKKSVWNWMWGRMYFTCNLYYILLIYALLLCFIVSEVVKSMAWLGYLQQKCLWIKFMEGSRRQSCSSLQVEIASGGIFFKRSLLCNQKSHTAQTHIKMITRARAINLKDMY